MIIIDTNIIFSSLLSFESPLLPIILDEKNNFAAPAYSFIEIFKHKEKILKYSRLNEGELSELLNIVFNRVNIISDKMISNDSLATAYDLCKNIDVKDIVFVALTLELNGTLWTGDKKLVSGLKKKGFDNFYIPHLRKPL